MDNVEEDQFWGILVGVVFYQFKNGWFDYGSDQWIVNLIGYVILKNGIDYMIVVYIDGFSMM